jgi:hypothetical protein
MPLGIEQLQNGQWGVTGISSEQGAPFPIGRRYFRPGNGPHYVGFDDSFAEPVIVKAFYDPAADADRLGKLGPDYYIGYMQFMQIGFIGQAIPPQVYGGRLADRAPYVTDSSGGFQFIDFMGPTDAKLRSIINPFYAFNGALLTQVTPSPRDFAIHPRPNGSLYDPDIIDDNKSLCASLTAEVSTNLITAADLTDAISSEDPIFEVTCSAQQWANKEAYQIVLEYLRVVTERREALAQTQGDQIVQHPVAQADDLAGVDNSELVGQVIGEYTLITLPSDENLAPHLCVKTSNSERKITVYLIDYYTMASLREDVVMRTLSNIDDYFQEKGIVVRPDSSRIQPTGTRGMSSLTPVPFKLSPENFFIALKYQTIAVACRPTKTRSAPGLDMISGFVWSAIFMFDEDSRTLTLSAIVAPEPLSSFDLRPLLDRYLLAVNDVDLSKATIDTSNFTKAAMRRDNFGAGVKLTFFNKSGQPII